MFDHVSIGVADIARSKKFYDAALKQLGFSRLSDAETSLSGRHIGGRVGSGRVRIRRVRASR